MNPLSRVFGVLFSLATLAAAITPHASLGSYIDIPAFLIVIGLVTGGLMASFGPRATLRTLRQALDGSPLPDRDVSESLRVARHGYHLAWAAGGVGVLVGVVNLLTNISDPNQLGGGISLALLSLLYGALLAELLFSNLTQWLGARGAGGDFAPRSV